MNRAGAPPALSRKRVFHFYALYKQKGYSLNELAEIFGIGWYQIWNGFRRYNLKRRPPHGARLRGSIRDQVIDRANLLPESQVDELRAEFLKMPKGRMGVRGYPEHFVQAMYADYVRNGELLSAVARKWNRSLSAVKLVFHARGLREPDPARRERTLQYQRVAGTGCFAKIKRASQAELMALIGRIVKDAKKGSRRAVGGCRRAKSKFRIPDTLKWEFRTWPMDKRAWFIRTVRAKLKSSADAPKTPYSSNVQPFDYCTPAAREIQAKLNAGLDSRHARCKIDTCSQGVIYKGDLWFWSTNTGYVARGWDPIRGRPILHQVIWEEHHGRKLPPQSVVRFIDGNRNNLAPENLVLASKNDVCRETQMKTLMRKSRERTTLLLERSQRKEKHGLIETLSKAA